MGCAFWKWPERKRVEAENLAMDGTSQTKVAPPMWGELFPQCADTTCSRVRGIWRRIYARQGGIRLHSVWYCAPQCFERAVGKRLSRTAVAAAPSGMRRHRIPLGLLMLSRGQLNNRQLRSALDAQRGNGGRIGRWLEDMGFATEQQVTAALGMQWACPVLPQFSDFSATSILPFRLLERFRMLPVRFIPQTRTLYVAFSERVDYTALYAVEQVLDCRSEPCLVGHSTMDAAIERLRHGRRSGELLLEGWRQPPEMAHITCGYALKLGAKNVRAVGCGEYVWVRLESDSAATDLMFRHFVPSALKEDLA